MYVDKKSVNTLGNPIFIATVEDNRDPTSNYRVKVRIKNIHDNLSTGALPWAAKVDLSFMGTSETGDIVHSIPEVGSQVLVLAIGNDINSLVYIGCLAKKTAATPNEPRYKETYGIYTKKGEFVGIEKINHVFHMIWEGDLSLDVKGKVKIGSEAIQPVVLGYDLRDLLNLMIATLNTHTHTGNLGIPTSTMSSPLKMEEILSKKVTVE